MREVTAWRSRLSAVSGGGMMTAWAGAGEGAPYPGAQTIVSAYCTYTVVLVGLMIATNRDAFGS